MIVPFVDKKEAKMTAAELLKRLNAHGLTLSIADTGQSLNVTGPLTPDLREVIRLHKAELISRLAYKIISYQVSNLYGQLPACYHLTDTGQVIAYYRNEAELADHVNRAMAAKRKYQAAPDLASAALALGGEFVPEMLPGDTIPF